MTTADPPRPLSVGGDFIAGDQHVTQTVAGDLIGRDQINNYINNIIQRALTAAEEAEQARAFEQQRLAQGAGALLQRFAQRAQAGAPGANPYKGLLEYRLADAEIFFGRQAAVAALLGQLARGPLTVLQSESGAGKTSLLQAGLAPRLLAAGHLPLYLRPYNVEPGYAIKRAFLADLSQAPELATAPLREFLRQVGAVLGPSTTLYLCLDQFEEYFTQLIPAAQDEFARELADCVHDTSLNVGWLLALRSEFFGRLHRFQQVGLRPFENAYTLLPLTRAEAREVAEAPAARRGVSFEPGLVERLLDDLGQSTIAPPQLQLVCTALFAELPPGQTAITQALYDAEGGVAGILRGHLERVLSRDLPREQRADARRLLEALVSSEQRRLVRTQAELAGELSSRGLAPPALDALLAQLVDSRLVKVQETDLGPAYELAHDYLLGEIRLDPDVQARKAAQELLEQETRAYRRYQTLLSAERLKVIEPYQAELRLTPEARELLAASQAAVAAEQQAEEARRTKELADAQALASATEAQRQAEAARARDAEHSAARLRRGNRALLVVGALALVAAVVAVGFAITSGQNARRAGDNALTAEAANTRSAANLGTAQAASTLAVGEAARSAAAEATAEARRLEAERQVRLALARELAAQSEEVLDVEPELGLLLALEAVRVAQAEATSVPEAEIALHRAVADSPYRGNVPSELPVVLSAALSPTGDHFALASDPITYAPEVELRRAADNTLVAALPGRDPRFSADGARLLTLACADPSNACDPDQVVVWDAATGLELARFETAEDVIVRAEFSSDSAQILTYACPDNRFCSDGQAQLWQPDGSPVAALAPDGGTVGAAFFSPDGQRLATVGDFVNLWSSAGEPLAVLTGTHAVFSPLGGLLATGQDDITYQGDTWLWNSAGELLNTVPGSYPLAVSPTGVLAALTGRAQVSLLPLASDNPLSEITPRSGEAPERVIFSPDGQYLVLASIFQPAELWTVNGTFVASLPSDYPENQYLFLPGRDRLVVTTCTLAGEILGCLDGVAQVLDLNGRLLATLTQPAAGVLDSALAPDGQSILTVECTQLNFATETFSAPCDASRVRWWDADASRLARLDALPPDYDYGGLEAQFLPDGRLLAVICDRRHAASVCDDNLLTVWDAATGTLQATLHAPGDRIGDISVSADGARVLVQNNDGDADLLDTRTGQRIEHLSRGGDEFPFRWLSPSGTHVLVRTGTFGGLSLVPVPGRQPAVELVGDFGGFSPDGQHLTTWAVPEGGDAVTFVWDLAGNRLAELAGEPLAFNLAGDQVLTVLCAEPNGTSPCGLLRWDLAGQNLSTYLPVDSAISSAGFLPGDGQVFARLFDQGLAVWHPDGDLLRVIGAGQLNAFTAVLSPDGRLFAGNRQTNSVQLWDAATGRLVATLSGHSGNVYEFQFSPNSQFLVTGGTDPDARLWDTHGNAVLALPLGAGPGASLSDARFSSDGTRLLGFTSRAIVLWEMYPDLPALVAAAEARVSRALTPGECEEYLNGPCP